MVRSRLGHAEAQVGAKKKRFILVFFPALK